MPHRLLASLLPGSDLQAAALSRLAGVPWEFCQGSFRALDFHYGIRSSNAEFGVGLAGSLAGTGSAPLGGETGVWLSALEWGHGEHRRMPAYLGARRLVATVTPSLVTAHFLWALNQVVVATAQNAILIHASAAERDGAVVVLPAAPESGKTTLVAGLLRRGYRYVTDEVVAIDIPTGQVRPYPKALSLETAAWRLFPELPEPPSGLIEAPWIISHGQFGTEVASPEAQPRVIISPRYRAGSRTALTRIPPSQGLRLLLDNSFNAQDWGQTGLDTAVATVRACPVIGTMAVGDLEDACDLIDQAVDEAMCGRG